MSVTYPKGFRAAAMSAGLKPSGNLDLALLVGDEGTTVAGLFTTNLVKAAPVSISQRRIASGDPSPVSVLVNSGQANAATGQLGVSDAERSTAAAARELGLLDEQVLPCSTGVIGEPIHMRELLEGLPKLVASLTSDGGDGFARAIMTTDTVAKVAVADAGPHRVGGCAKGAGMIAPSLATMLSFITTDAAVSAANLSALAQNHLKPVFNSVTVDGCTSTNDTVLLFASGAAGQPEVVPATPEWAQLESAVAEVGASLARQLIADGEGVKHVMLVRVEGASDVDAARVMAKAVADSPLVKTAIFGEDANPGRILQALGSSGAWFDPDAVDVRFGDVALVRSGVVDPACFDGPELVAAAAAEMAGPEVNLEIRVGDGPGSSLVLGCDLTYEYVRINGEYTT